MMYHDDNDETQWLVLWTHIHASMVMGKSTAR